MSARGTSGWQWTHGEMVSFGLLCPDLARHEVLQVVVRRGGELPPGTYAFLEFHCPDPECDCQVVMWHVVGRDPMGRDMSDGPLATLAWCWAPDDPHGPEIEPAPQTRLAPELLRELLRAMRDMDYGAQVQAHYAAVRRDAVTPGTPVYRLIHHQRVGKRRGQPEQ